MIPHTLFYRYDEYGVKEWGTLSKVGLTFLILHLYSLSAAYGIFYFESMVENSNIQSYSDAVWLVYMSATTIGFGDVYPITTGGRILVLTSFAIGVGLTSFIGVTIAAKLTGFTDTTVKNRELRHLLRESIERDKVNEHLNREIFNMLMEQKESKCQTGIK